MALSFPLGLSTFFRALPYLDITFHPTEGAKVLVLGSGEVLSAGYGTRLWRGTVTVGPRAHAEHEQIMVLVRALQRPGATFFATPLHLRRPGAPAAVLNGVSGRDVRFSGLEGGTVVPRGAFFSFEYGSNPTRYAFHQLAQELTANSSGVTGYGEAVPPVRPGYGNGAAVTFDEPRLKAKLIPGTVEPARLPAFVAEGASFEWTQTLR